MSLIVLTKPNTSPKTSTPVIFLVRSPRATAVYIEVSARTKTVHYKDAPSRKQWSALAGSTELKNKFITKDEICISDHPHYSP
jgi:hypothetical protein